jgi:hypothetical protein
MKKGHRAVENSIRMSNIYLSLHTLARDPLHKAMARTPIRIAPSYRG